jgi:hypothetical protein
MESPHDLFKQTLASTGDYAAAIRAIRLRFGMSLRQAKEVMLQTQGIAASLDEHQERIAVALEQEFWDRAAREGLPRFRCIRRSLLPEQIDQSQKGTMASNEKCREIAGGWGQFSARY